MNCTLFGFTRSSQHMSSPRRLRHVPRLNISILLLWMVVTSVMLSSYIFPRYGSELELPVVLPDLAEYLLFGAALSGCFIIAWHWIHRSLWPLEPGEFLIIAAGLVGASIISWRTLSLVFISMKLDSNSLFLTLFHLAIALIYTSVAIVVRRQERWAIVLSITAMSELALSVVGIPLGAAGYLVGFS